MSSVAIIDYGSGNLHSAKKACERVARDTGHVIIQTSDPDTVRNADYVILPGVGAFGDCKAGLEAIDGMHEALDEAVLKKKVPFLGICVGMQLMAERGLERGEHKGFGWLSGAVEKIRPNDIVLKVPHMGWNSIAIQRDHPVLEDISDRSHAYFVHSYHMQTADEFVLAKAEYGGYITAIVAKDNMVGTQFHPEKSQETGLLLIKNFLTWDGTA